MNSFTANDTSERILFGGEGLSLLELSGTRPAFISSYGAIDEQVELMRLTVPVFRRSATAETDGQRSRHPGPASDRNACWGPRPTETASNRPSAVRP